MTLDEAIIHAEKAAERNAEYAKIHAHGDEFEQEDAFKCEECAKEHRQLAEWLKELKQYKEYDMGKQALRGFLEGIGAPVDEQVDEQVDDCISRQAAIDLADELKDDLPDDDHLSDMVMSYNEGILEYQTKLSLLPPVTPAEKVGWWEWVQYDGNPNIGNWHCSECNRIVCGAITAVNPVYSYKYCPECGTKMQEVEE